LKIFIITILAFCGIIQIKPLTEKQKIDALINYVAQLKDAKFIRNGSEHTCKEAANHLKMKLKNAGDDIQTAKQFIQELASKSSLSGKPYEILLSNGKRVKSETFFLEKLKEIESKH